MIERGLVWRGDAPFGFLILKVWLLALAMPAFAQNTGQWADDLYYINVSGYNNNVSGMALSTSVFIDENNKIHKKIPALESKDFPVTAWFGNVPPFDSYWRNEAAYLLGEGVSEKNEDGSYFTRWVFAKWTEDEGWHFQGDYKTDTNEMLEAIPCDNDRFIVISCAKDLTGDNRWQTRTPFARMSLHPDKKELRLDTPIDHGQDELRKYMSNPDFFKLAWLSQPCLTRDHATLINCNTGLYWIFSLEKASLTKAGNIFKSATPEWIAKGGFTSSVLCARPEKAETILIAAQEEDYLIKANDPWKQALEFREKFNATNEEQMEMFKHYYQEYVNRSPFIAWYRVYPETGKVEKLKEHPEGGTWYRVELNDGHDAFRPMPDGSVKMNWRSEEWRLIDELNKQKLKKTDNKGKFTESQDTKDSDRD